MIIYFLNLFFILLQISPKEEVIQTYHTLQVIAWTLIISTLVIFILFGYLIYIHMKKRGRFFTLKTSRKQSKVHP